jgi:DNA-binding response OmpR family regulator
MATRCPCCGQELKGEKLLVDLEGNTIAYGNKKVRVSRREAEFARILVQAFPREVPRQEIIDQLFGSRQTDPSKNLVSVYAHKLRPAFYTLGFAITSSYGTGYRLSRVEE